MEIWEEHPVVYHYTTQAGLNGIIDTHSLHATHYMFTNDATETLRLKPKLEQMILKVTTQLYQEAASDRKKKEAMDAAGGPEFLAKHDASKTADTIYQITFGINSDPKFFQPFVTSFCGHKKSYDQENGLLSQWRGYGKESGYALEFDTKKLAELLKTECGDRYLYDLWAMGDVIYDSADEAVFNREFKDLSDAVDLDVPRLLRGEKGPYTALNHQFIGSVSRYKHRGFEEEQEVRFVVSPTDDWGIELLKASGKFDKQKHKSKKTIKFKETLSPYVVLFEDPDVQLPIARIIVGPHRDKEVRHQRLQKQLELRRLKIEVTCSETPFV
jgi:hypothetical protein